MDFGGFLRPNAYKVLQVMAWHAYDPPHGPKGPKEQPANLFFLSADTTCHKAFGRPMPPAPGAGREEWTAEDREANAERRTVYSTLTAAIRELMDLGVISRKLSAKPGVRPAHYELHLNRLEKASTDQLIRKTETRKSSQAGLENPVSQDKEIQSRKTRKSSLSHCGDKEIQSPKTRNSSPEKPSRLENPVSRDKKICDQKNKGDFQPSTSIGQFQESPQATNSLAHPTHTDEEELF
ncbi:hypothetical protein [Arthrobacter sp.]|uniref:hypothetical protein n=1 Tax=Arthrobacter sp. TaxID=1667 RepID=UPI003A91142B